MSKEKEVLEQTAWTMDKASLIKIGWGLLFVVSEAGLTYISEILAPIDFGNFTPVVMAFWAMVVIVLRQYIKGKKESQ